MRRPGSSEPPPPQYTVEGQIHMLGELAMGLKRVRGWRRALAWLMVLAALAGGVMTAVPGAVP